MSNYPPGVTGNEFAIAGPDFEDEDSAFCPRCAQDRDGTVLGYQGERWFVCGSCETQTDLPSLDDEGPDPDAAYDALVERQEHDRYDPGDRAGWEGDF